MRAAILARVSSERQAGALKASLSSQETLLRKKAEEMGMEVVRVFSIPGESAFVDIARRPKFRECLAAAMRREFDVILITEFSRFWRDERQSHNTLHELRGAGVGLVALNGIDYVADRDYATIDSWMAARANRDHSRRVSNGLRGKFEAGLLVGDIPLGYRRVMAEDGKGGIVPDTNVPPAIVPEEASAIAWAFDAYTKARSLKEIAEEFNRRGLRPRSKVGLLQFEASSIQSILENRTYAGFVTYKGEAKEGQHAAIVSIEQWAAVQSKAESGLRAQRTDSLLTGLARCIRCQRPITSKRSVNMYEERRRLGRECETDGKRIRMDVAHREVERAFSGFEPSASWLNYCNSQLRRPMQATAPGERTALDERRRRVVRAYESGAMSDEEFDRALRGIKDRAASFSPDIDGLKVSIERMSSWMEVWSVAKEGEKREVLQRALDGVEIDLESGEVWLRPSSEAAAMFALRAAYVSELHIGTPDRTQGFVRASGIWLPDEIAA